MQYIKSLPLYVCVFVHVWVHVCMCVLLLKEHVKELQLQFFKSIPSIKLLSSLLLVLGYSCSIIGTINFLLIISYQKL